MLGAILTSSDILGKGQRYTFTFQLTGPTVFGVPVYTMPSADSFIPDFREALYNIGDLISITRSLFSDYYVITVVPNENYSLSVFLDVFDSIWKQIGYTGETWSYNLIRAEGGAVSTSPGGLPGVTEQVGEVVSGAVGDVLKPVIPYALLLLGGYLLIVMLPTIVRSHHARSR